MNRKSAVRWTTTIITVFLIAIFIERSTLPPTTMVMEQQAKYYLSQTGKDTPPHLFTQDGCSLFPDSFPGHDFSSACLAHDIQYWAGGSNAERKAADIALRDEIEHTGPLGPFLAPVMYVGVRLFGNSLLTRAVNAHWGYGWD